MSEDRELTKDQYADLAAWERDLRQSIRRNELIGRDDPEARERLADIAVRRDESTRAYHARQSRQFAVEREQRERQQAETAKREREEKAREDARKWKSSQDAAWLWSVGPAEEKGLLRLAKKDGIDPAALLEVCGERVGRDGVVYVARSPGDYPRKWYSPVREKDPELERARKAAAARLSGTAA